MQVNSVFSGRAGLFLAAFLLVFSVQAHEPEEHMTMSEPPKCAAIENMGSADMDKDDPVMRAMMHKCMAMSRQSDPGSDTSPTIRPNESEEDHASRSVGHEH